MSQTLDQLRTGFGKPDASCRPLMRWWWFGPQVCQQEIDRELQAMADAGLGGVEVAYVYPLTEQSPEFLSVEFLHHLRYAAERARDLGLRFDLTLGSGWSFGGPHIGPELAAKKLHWQRREVAPDGFRVQVASSWPGEEFVAAYIGAGSVQETPTHLTRLAVEDGVLVVPEGSGPRQLLLAYARLTGQVVKRAAAGADGYVLDHYSAAATREHLAQVGTPLLDAVPARLLGSVFCDSLEVYQSDWTPELPKEFERRRGYPLLDRAYNLVLDGVAASTEAARLRADYYRTLTELYEENFLRECQQWATARGVLFRVQSYGVPPGAVSSFRYADLYEGEGWGWKELTQTRWASSAAYLYGQSVVSAESWTWIHSPSFRATPLDLKGEAHEHFLSGINHLVGHGWPYSPSKSEGLGWFFYAAGALDDRNPWWPAMPEVTSYLRRLSWLLQQGERCADVLVYVPATDVYASLGGSGSLDLWRGTRAHIPESVPATIRESGRDYVLVDDVGLGNIDPDETVVVVVAGTTCLPRATRAWLDRVQDAGGTVIAVDSPALDQPAVAFDDLAGALDRALAPDVRLSPVTGQVGVVHRRVGAVEAYVVVNTGPTIQRCRVQPRTPYRWHEQWDPHTGTVVDRGRHRDHSRTEDGIPVELHPYQAAVVVTTPEPPSHTPPRRLATTTPLRPTGLHEQPILDILSLDQDWSVRFGDEQATTVQLPHIWEDDPDRRHYAGKARYTTSVTLPDDWLAADNNAVVLDFGSPFPGDPDGDDPTPPTDAGSDPGSQSRSSAASRSIPGSDPRLGSATRSRSQARATGDSAPQTRYSGKSYRVALTAPVGEVVRVEVNGRAAGLLWDPPYHLAIGHLLRPGANDLALTVFNTAAGALAADASIERRVAASRAGYGLRFQMQDLPNDADGLISGILRVPVLQLRARDADA